MQQVSARRTINANHTVVWPLVANVTNIALWHPTIAKVDLLSKEPTGLNAARRCTFKDGTSVREDVVGVTDGRTIRFKLTEFSVPMDRLELQIDATPSGGSTEAAFTLSYQVKFGIVGRLLGATVMRGQLQKMVERLIAGLAGRAEQPA